jgi:hypothetical protein
MTMILMMTVRPFPPSRANALVSVLPHADVIAHQAANHLLNAAIVIDPTVATRMAGPARALKTSSAAKCAAHHMRVHRRI